MEMKSVAAKDYALIDLHLHLDGSLSLASVRELDRRFSNLSERSGQKTGKETVKR